MITLKIKNWNDTTGKNGSTSIQNTFQAYLDVVAQQFNVQFGSKDVVIAIDLTVSSGSGISASAGPAYYFDFNSTNWINPVEKLIKTGVDINGANAEMTLTVSDGLLTNMSNLWAKSNVVSPVGGLSILNHEFGHGLGFDSFRNKTTGNLDSSFGTTFDKYVGIIDGNPYFVGYLAKAIYGGNVPLQKLGSSDAISHLSKAYLNGTIQDQIVNDTMIEGEVTPSLKNSSMSNLDAAILRQLGYDVKETITSFDGTVQIPGTNTTTITGTASAHDRVVFVGNRNDHLVSRSGNDIVDTYLATSSTIKMINVERLEFADATIAMDINGIAGKAYRIYQAAFDRTPDLAGLGYWIGQMDSGAETFNHVAAGFVISAEFQRLYGANLTNNGFLTALYNNVLHRNPDQAGFDYWNGRISEGMARSDILASFSESNENQAQVIGVIQNGFQYIPYHY